MEKEIWYRDSNNSTGNIIAEIIGQDLYQLKESALFSKRYLFGVKVKATLKDDDKIWIDEIVDFTEVISLLASVLDTGKSRYTYLTIGLAVL